MQIEVGGSWAHGWNCLRLKAELDSGLQWLKNLFHFLEFLEHILSLWYWIFFPPVVLRNSEPCTCKSSTIEPGLHTFCFFQFVFQVRCWAFAWAGLRWGSFYLCIQSSWDYRCHHYNQLVLYFIIIIFLVLLGFEPRVLGLLDKLSSS